jgi:hypothetical protein
MIEYDSPSAIVAFEPAAAKLAVTAATVRMVRDVLEPEALVES